MDAPLTCVWDFHAEPLNLPHIMPGPMRVVQRDAPLHAGGAISLRLGAGVLGMDWLLRVVSVDAPHKFVDSQVRGPWARWRHTHAFMRVSDTRTRVIDQIEFALPLWPLCAPLEWTVARIAMPLMMRYRQRKTRVLLEK